MAPWRADHLTDDDQKWMAVALDLAERGRGLVEPNPLVGAIVVREGEVVGSAGTRDLGRPTPRSTRWRLPAPPQRGRRCMSRSNHAVIMARPLRVRMPSCALAFPASSLA